MAPPKRLTDGPVLHTERGQTGSRWLAMIRRWPCRPGVTPSQTVQSVAVLP